MKLLALLPLVTIASAQYSLVRQYSGSSFFNGWEYYGTYDNTTNGDVNYLNQADANSQKLTYVNDAGNAIIKVDDTTNVLYNDKRNTIRITTADAFPIGTLILFDALHVPFGCSVWPSFWTKGPNWPAGGEIDIFETVNLMTFNQMALHTGAGSGCTQPQGTNQTGTTGANDCTQSAGCVVADNNHNSVGAGFAQAGGGLWATQFDTSGIFIWFWNRANIPANIQQSGVTTLDTSSWGTPTAAYPSSGCNFGQYFTSQQLVIDITLCGDWAGQGAVYNQTCQNAGTTGICYNDNVIGNGTNYQNAYFEVSSIKVFANPSIAPSLSASLASGTSGPSPSNTNSPGNGNGNSAGFVAKWSPTAIFGALIAAVLQIRL